MRSGGYVFFFILLLIAAFTPPAMARSHQPYVLARASLERPGELQRLSAMGLDVVKVDRGSYLEFVSHQTQIEELRALGFEIDVLIEDIDIQGDTEFASVEQQVHLLANPPSRMDYKHALILMAQEIRHGVQMCDVLLNHFGETGRRYAERLLERNALDDTRRLGAFNGEVRNWLGFWLYTTFQDRDGKYQLVMWWHSAFAPMGSSMSPMLMEEGFHIWIKP